MKYIKGDLIELSKAGHFDVIVHGCNCFHTMGAGIAAQIAKEFPEAYEADKKTVYGASDKLGTYSAAKIENLTIVNAYTQHKLGSRYNSQPADYMAIQHVFAKISRDFVGKKLGIPKIGCGLGGAKWCCVERIIDEQCPDMDITCVEYDG